MVANSSFSSMAMRESIREGLETPIDDCVEELDW